MDDQSIGISAMYFSPLDFIFRKQHSLGAVLYYFMRQRKAQQPVIWKRYDGLSINSKNQLCTDPMLLSGIIVSIVGCPVNKNERIDDRYWLPSTALQDVINDLWGNADQIQNRVMGQASICSNTGR